MQRKVYIKCGKWKIYMKCSMCGSNNDAKSGYCSNCVRKLHKKRVKNTILLLVLVICMAGVYVFKHKNINESRDIQLSNEISKELERQIYKDINEEIENGQDNNGTILENPIKQYFVDEAGIFNLEEIKSINAIYEEISTKLECDFSAIVVNEMDLQNDFELALKSVDYSLEDEMQIKSTVVFVYDVSDGEKQLYISERANSIIGSFTRSHLYRELDTVISSGDNVKIARRLAEIFEALCVKNGRLYKYNEADMQIIEKEIKKSVTYSNYKELLAIAEKNADWHDRNSIGNAFALLDMDDDGIEELIVETSYTMEYMPNTKMYYLFNGEDEFTATDIGEICCTYPPMFIVNNNILGTYDRMSDYLASKYYSLDNGELKEVIAESIKLGEINNEFIYEYRMNGENVSESECDPYLTYFDGIENPKRPNQGSFVV